jgi:23S rRNA (cytosine1962-C5)-methyltransferase
MTKLATVTIEDRAAKRLRAGYPWLFRSELSGKTAAEDGETVDFMSGKGEFVARGFYNSKSQLAGRVLARNAQETVDEEFFAKRVASAVRHRAAVIGTGFCRLIHAESDGFPGLIVDRYGDVIVAQVNTAGMNHLWPHVQAALTDQLKPAAIILRNDSSAREQEGMAQETVIALGKAPDAHIQIVENDTRFAVDVIEGQKTGWFFDQRQNRMDVARIAAGKTLLDVFCHTGGFGVTALKHGATGVTFIDTSAKALEDAKANVALNGIKADCTYLEGRAFDVMEKLAQDKKTYGVVCVDPPAFIKTRKDMAVGMKAYQKLGRLAAALTAKGGYIFFASCSHHADLTELAGSVAEGIGKTGRPFQLVRTAGAGPDHPVHPFLPETGYLKALTYRFID